MYWPEKFRLAVAVRSLNKRLVVPVVADHFVRNTYVVVPVIYPETETPAVIARPAAVPITSVPYVPVRQAMGKPARRTCSVACKVPKLLAVIWPLKKTVSLITE